MSAISEINGVYYFRLRIPKDVKKYFRHAEVKKSTHTGKYKEAKGVARDLLGKIERVFMVIRSKVLDDAAVLKLVRDFTESTLARI